MALVVLVFLGGVLTILSPCILPVLPFVFARAQRPFLSGGLPLLVGMAVTFAAVASLAAVGGSWAVHLNQYGRVIALIVLALFAVTLLSPRLAEGLARPFLALGNRLQAGESAGPSSGIGRSLLLGIATGLLWAPCAGPILGLVLTGAVIAGPNAHTSVLLFAYAAGSATSLAVATLAGARVFALLKRSLGAGEWVRRALGVAVLLAVAVIALGWDTGPLARLSLARTQALEQSLIDGIRGTAAASAVAPVGAAAVPSSAAALPVEGRMPELDGATAWLNSSPLTTQALRGKVVLIDFWTYSCINCLRSLPYVKSWYDKYKDHGLVVIGVHAPEFAFEKDLGNVRRAVADLGVKYPVALDNNYAIWQGFDNQYWPAHYFIDSQGRIRGHHFGEGDYDQSEQTLRLLLGEAGFAGLPAAGMTAPALAAGVQAAADLGHLQSPETYLGVARAQNFASPGGAVADKPHDYGVPAQLGLNQWALSGRWVVSMEDAVLPRAPGGVVFRFYARDLHLVMGSGATGKALRFVVKLDGKAPGAAHGGDVDAAGMGVLREQRLYQLIRQPGDIQQHTFSIEFLDGGAQVYSFTFG